MTEKTLHNISYSFIPKGSVAGSVEYPIENNKIYLNVGGCICAGALDHHQGGKNDCTTQIICENPHLVFAGFNSNPDTFNANQN